jgi:hypothetical protein
VPLAASSVSDFLGLGIIFSCILYAIGLGATEESMASIEGAVRMKRVGKILILCGLSSAVLGAITLFLGYLQRAQPYHPPVILLGLGTMALFYLGILPMIAGGALWVGGWVAEGFLAPQRPD